MFRLALKCNQNDNYAKTQATISVQAQLLCKLTNASCQQKETTQVIFFYTRGQGRTISSKLPAEG